ncbi:hypothetical protein GCM10027259_39690 [Micromonospora palomenae]
MVPSPRSNISRAASSSRRAGGVNDSSHANGMDRVTVSTGAAVFAGRRWPPGGRPGTAGWDVCHPARDEAGLTDMVLLGWSG